MKVLVISGPGVNLLGQGIYGSWDVVTYASLQDILMSHASKCGLKALFTQSNCEGALVDAIHNARSDKLQGIVINPAAYMFNSIAIYDALNAFNGAVVHVEIENAKLPSDLKSHKVTTLAADIAIMGFDTEVYTKALCEISKLLKCSEGTVL